jgi:hypothetical protein
MRRGSVIAAEQIGVRENLPTSLDRQERDFWMQRQGRRNHRQRRQKPVETKRGRKARGNPGTNGAFGPDLETLGSEGLLCAVRYEPVSLLFSQYQGLFRKKQRSGRQKCQKALQHRHFPDIATIQYQGRTGSALAGQQRAGSTRTGIPQKLVCDMRPPSYAAVICGPRDHTPVATSVSDRVSSAGFGGGLRV